MSAENPREVFDENEAGIVQKEEEVNSVVVENKSNKKLIIALVTIFVLLVGAILGYFYIYNKPANQETNMSNLDVEKAQLEQYLSTYAGEVPLRISYGTVTKNDTVCKDQEMFVVSAQDPIFAENPLGRPLQADGSFVTLASKDAPQLLMILNSSKEVCLSATSFPGNDSPIIFDAKSTTLSTAFPSGFIKVDEYGYQKIQELKNFAPLYQFIQNTLKIKTMTAISMEALKDKGSDEYLTLMWALSEEIVLPN